MELLIPKAKVLSWFYTSEETMQTTDIFSLGLGLQTPWEIVVQNLDINKTPHKLHLKLVAERGALYPCPVCGTFCKAHDYLEMTWHI